MSFYYLFVTGKNLQELERLNKAIEAVKNEVEEKQKTLLLFTNGTQSAEDPAAKVDGNCNIVEDAVKKLQTPVRESCAAVPVSAKSRNPIPKKYIVDRSCPATDLEYDPLLNYSAGFFGSNTKGKENESKLKSKRKSENELNNPQKRPRAASPIRLEIKLQESDEEDMLVIDVPPLLEVSKKPRANKVCGTKEEQFLLRVDAEVQEEGKVLSADAVENVTENPVAVKTDSENETLPCSLGETAHTNDHGQTPESSDHCISSEPDPCPEVERLTHETCITASSDETGNEGSAAAIAVESDCPEDCQPSLPETSMKQPGQIVNDEADHDGEATEVTICSDPIITDEQKCVENEVIIVNSSSETENSSEEETDLSDSDDPIEECRRIFNEFTEREAKRKSAQVGLPPRKVRC